METTLFQVFYDFYVARSNFTMVYNHMNTGILAPSSLQGVRTKRRIYANLLHLFLPKQVIIYSFHVDDLSSNFYFFEHRLLHFQNVFYQTLNETRQDETGGQYPNWGTRTILLLYGPVARENPGNKRDRMGLLSITRESLKQYQILRLFPENLYKQYHSGLFLVGTINITYFCTNLVPLP